MDNELYFIPEDLLTDDSDLCDNRMDATLDINENSFVDEDCGCIIDSTDFSTSIPDEEAERSEWRERATVDHLEDTPDPNLYSSDPYYKHGNM